MYTPCHLNRHKYADDSSDTPPNRFLLGDSCTVACYLRDKQIRVFKRNNSDVRKPQAMFSSTYSLILK